MSEELPPPPPARRSTRVRADSLAEGLLPPEPRQPEPLPSIVTPPLAPHAAGSLPASWEWPSVHPEGFRFAGMAGAIAAVALLAGWGVVGALMVALTIFILAFFRDPKRASPAGEGLIISPADGLVSQIVEVELPRQLVGEGALAPGTATRISIFMSVFDVHINRAPIAGTVTRMAYVPGAFLNADLDKASEENERQYILIEGADGTQVGFTQIAGLIARRIVGFVREGTVVGTGQRVGLIRFGSRVDVFLPAGFAPQVVKGQRAVAGETLLAVRGATAARPGPLQ
jgi:phosphatidylserine decarboxylase